MIKEWNLLCKLTTYRYNQIRIIMFSALTKAPLSFSEVYAELNKPIPSDFSSPKVTFKGSVPPQLQALISELRKADNYYLKTHRRIVVCTPKSIENLKRIDGGIGAEGMSQLLHDAQGPYVEIQIDFDSKKVFQTNDQFESYLGEKLYMFKHEESLHAYSDLTREAEIEKQKANPVAGSPIKTQQSAQVQHRKTFHPASQENPWLREIKRTIRATDPRTGLELIPESVQKGFLKRYVEDVKLQIRNYFMGDPHVRAKYQYVSTLDEDSGEYDDAVAFVNGLRAHADNPRDPFWNKVTPEGKIVSSLPRPRTMSRVQQDYLASRERKVAEDTQSDSSGAEGPRFDAKDNSAFIRYDTSDEELDKDVKENLLEKADNPAYSSASASRATSES